MGRSMLSRTKARVRGEAAVERGASLVEFALLAPLLLTLLFGVIESGRALFAYTTVWSSAREGARAATTLTSYLDCDAIRDAAMAKAITVDITAGDIEIVYRDPIGNTTADCDDTDPGFLAPTALTVPSGSSVEVSVSGTFDSIVPIVAVFFDGLTLDSAQSRVVYISEEVGG